MASPGFLSHMKMPALYFHLLLISLGGNAFAQTWAQEQLNKSPRHHEWVDLQHDDRTVKTFIAFPEVKEKAPVVIVIHEIFGLTDWAKNLADELAAAGYIAIAPDLLSERGKDSQTYSDKEAAIKAVSALPPPPTTRSSSHQAMARLRSPVIAGAALNLFSTQITTRN